MNNADLCFLSAIGTANLIKDRKLSPVDLVNAVLERIEKLEPQINAFSSLTAETALEKAKWAESEIAKNAPIGRLHGVPVTVKDLASVINVPFQRGSRIDADNIGTLDEPLVKRLKNSGAIILGKTTTSEFGWKGVSHSPLTGITHNPWKHGYNAGASSAGAGAAAAAGFGALHHGSDGAGSIRMPAHFCGVFGFKPSFGRVPYAPVGIGDQTSHNGPITRTVEDAALMLEVISGSDPLDHYSLETNQPNYIDSLKCDLTGKRIAFSPDLGHARVDPDIAAIIEKAAETFVALGANVELVTPNWASRGPDLIRFFWAAHELRFRCHIKDWADQMDPGLVACIEYAGNPSVEEYLLMRQRKLDYISAIHNWFQNWDLLLTPAVSVAAFPADRLQPDHWPEHEWDWLSWAEFSYPFNFAHNPAASIPCGFTDAGLPVGLQIVGKRLEDLEVLQACAAFEEANPWAQKRPQIETIVK